MPVEPVVPPLRQHCWIDHLFTAKRWRDGNVPRWERRAGQFVFTLGLLCRGQQASPMMHPSELVGLEDPEGPFRSWYWDFEIGGGKNLSKMQTNLGNGFHLLLRTPVSFLYIISFILHGYPVRCGCESHFTPGSKRLNNLCFNSTVRLPAWAKNSKVNQSSKTRQ